MKAINELMSEFCRRFYLSELKVLFSFVIIFSNHTITLLIGKNGNFLSNIAGTFFFSYIILYVILLLIGFNCVATSRN